MAISQYFKPFALLVLALMLGLWLANSYGQEPANDSQGLTMQRLEKLAIQESIAGYLIAVNDKDADMAASYWSDNGEWIDVDGTRVRGRQAITTALADSFATDRANMTVALRNLTIRMISPTTAIEDGVAVISIPGEEDSEASYSVVHVKENGSWKINTVRETLTPSSPATQSQLKALSWLVGDWVDQVEGDVSIETSCDWTEGNKALRRSFRITENGQVVKKGTQVILWDARLGKIRSWMFDSDGGFGNGIWQQQGPSSWSIDAEFQLADGGVATATNVYSGISDTKFEFQSVNRTIDGVGLDDIPAIAVVKSKQTDMTQTINPNTGWEK